MQDVDLTHSGVRVQLAVLYATRLLTSTFHRMVIPLLPVFARGLGVDIASLASIIALRQGLGVVAPVFGITGDFLGRRFSILLGLILFIASLASLALWPIYPTFIAALLVAAIGKTIMDPAIFAFIGDRVQPHRRGLAVSLSEFSWAGSLLLGAPVVAWTMANYGWSAPFPLLAGLGVVASIVLWRTIPLDNVRGHHKASIGNTFRFLLRERAPYWLLLVGLFFGTANGVLSIVYGTWLEDSYSFRIAGLGMATGVVGLAELAGEGMAASLADRMGRKRAMALGLGLNAISSASLVLLQRSSLGAVLGLMLFFITYEFGVVSSIPMMMDIAPNARATLISSRAAVQRSGVAIGILLGAALFRYGIAANALCVAAIDLIALASLLVTVPSDKPPQTPNARDR